MSKNVNTQTVIFVIAFSVFFCVLPDIANAQDYSRSAAVLEESYRISENLSYKNRAFFLVRLADFSTSISPKRTEGFCEELLKLARKLPADWNRVATEKNGLVPLARINPQKAFALLPKVERPIPKKDGFTEDVRADAAASIFLSYFNAKNVGVSGIPAIRQAAVEIGRTGEFPHRAIGLIIEQLFRSGEQKLSINLFDQALHFYERGSLFQDEDPEFFLLLQSARFAVPADLYKRGLEEFVLHLTSSKSKEPANFKAEVQNGEGMFTFNSQKKLLLFRIMPTLIEFDREKANELMHQDSSLIHAGIGIRSIAAIGGPATQTENLPYIQQEMEQVLVQQRIQRIQDADPIAALADARGLPFGSVARTAALSSIIPSLIQFNQIKARDAYDELQASIDSLPPGKPRLRGLASTARAAYFVSNSRDLYDYSLRAFDYGLEIMTSTSRDKDAVVLEQSGSSDWLNSVDFAAEHLGEPVLSWIRSVQNDNLKAYLLLFAANGLGKAEANARTIAQNEL